MDIYEQAHQAQQAECHNADYEERLSEQYDNPKNE